MNFLETTNMNPLPEEFWAPATFDTFENIDGGIVHAWVGQNLLKVTILRVYSRLSGTDESGDAAPLSEATADLS